MAVSRERMRSLSSDNLPPAKEFLDIDMMPESEAVALLQSFSPHTDTQSLQALANTLGYLSLALTQAGSYLQENKLSPRSYLSLYAQDAPKTARLLASLPPDAQVLPIVLRTWNLSFEQLILTKEGQESAQLLRLCAFLSPEAIPKALLEACLQANDPSLSEPSLALNERLALLARYSLIKLEETQISLHCLLQKALSCQQPLTQADYLAFATLLDSEFSRETQPLEDEAREKELLPHLESFLGHYQAAWSDKKTALAHARLWYDRGLFFEYRLAQYADAKHAFEQALAVQEAHYGPDHVKVATTLLNLGEAYGSLGGYPQQKACLERALLIEERVYGPDHAKVGTTLLNLGGAYGSLGDYPRQKTCLERVLLIEERVHGSEHANVADILLNLGELLKHLGDRAKSQTYFRRAHELFLKACGAEHPCTQLALKNIQGARRALWFSAPSARAVPHKTSEGVQSKHRAIP